MATKLKDLPQPLKIREGTAREEIDRVNARLRHFRGVAAGVMRDALELWGELWNACQEHRSCEELLDGVPESPWPQVFEGREAYLEKLHLLGTYIDYAKRLCEGSIDQQIHQESEVESCPDSSPL